MANCIPTPDIVSLKLSPQELGSKQLTSHHLQNALEALHRDGVVILKNAVKQGILDRLNERMLPEALQLYEGDSTRHNFGTATGNIQQAPPLEADFTFEEVVANKFATTITEHILGPHPVLRFQNGNTAFKSDGRQPVHVDLDFDFPNIPFGFAININLVDVDCQNGATEVWPGTHLKGGQFQLLDGIVRPELVEERRVIRPPVRVICPKGSLVIRDLRLWHAGVGNRTASPRIMINLMQFASWYRSDSTLYLPSSARDKLDFGSLQAAVQWVEEKSDAKYDSFTSLIQKP